MWANTCWGFTTIAIALGLARLAMIWTVGHEEWGPRLLYAAVFMGILSMICFLWPLFKRRGLISSIQPDMTISDVTNYMVNDSSVVLKKPKAAEIEQFGPAKDHLVNWPGIGHVDAISRVQTALNNGNLKSWGRREIMANIASFQSSLRPIPKEYWELACINPFFCFHKSDRAQTMALPKRDAELYASLTLNKEQVRSLWVPGPLWRRIFMDLGIIKRKNYFGKSINKHYNPIKEEP